MTFSLQKLAAAVDEATEDSQIAKKVVAAAQQALINKPAGTKVLVKVDGKQYLVALK